MSWTLLTDRSVNLRYLVLKHLMHSDEADELEKHRQEDGIVKELLSLQTPDGSWGQPAITGNAPQGKVQTTSQALTRLGFLEFNSDHSAVKKGAEYLFSQQGKDGSWHLGNYRTDAEGHDNYDVMSLQTSLPLLGLVMSGYAEDSRAETSYDWLLEQRLDDGAWPTGVASGNYGSVAGYRRLAHSRWGCRSNTTAALTCLSLHKERRRGEAARRALDLLLGRETRERHHIGYDTARTVGAEDSTGFLTYYARFDLAYILKLCVRLGASLDDPRVEELAGFVVDQRGENGLWEYTSKPQASKWVTYDLLRTLGELGKDADWTGSEPRTPFQPYPVKRKRF
jgi:hypothetical protein